MPEGLAEPEDAKAGGRDLSFATSLLEIPHRLVDALRGQLDGAVMHADAADRLEINVSLHRFGGIHVHRLHEPARLVGANRQQREIDRSESPANIRKERRVGRIACEIQAEAADADHESAPQRAVTVE